MCLAPDITRPVPGFCSVGWVALPMVSMQSAHLLAIERPCPDKLGFTGHDGEIGPRPKLAYEPGSALESDGP